MTPEKREEEEGATEEARIVAIEIIETTGTVKAKEEEETDNMEEETGLRGESTGVKEEKIGLKGEKIGLRGEKTGLKGEKTGLKGERREQREAKGEKEITKIEDTEGTGKRDLKEEKKINTEKRAAIREDSEMS